MRPGRQGSFKVINDPKLSEELDAIAGLHLNPPEHVMVLSVDEKSQIQLLTARSSCWLACPNP